MINVLCFTQKNKIKQREGGEKNCMYATHEHGIKTKHMHANKEKDQIKSRGNYKRRIKWQSKNKCVTLLRKFRLLRV